MSTSVESKLSADRVQALVLECLFRDEELENGKPKNMEDVVEGAGVLRRLGFNKSRVEQHREEIKAMLMELPDEFMASKGGGMTFLNMCTDKHGNHWAEHNTMDALICLGMAIDMVAFPLPREVWSVLPGGVPYVMVKDQ